MVQKKRNLDKELRHSLEKEVCYEMMDYLMVHFSEKPDYHYNYYFDNESGELGKRNITLRLRSALKDKAISYMLTLKIPTIEQNTYLEYNQSLDEKEMRLLAHNTILPSGEIAELTSIHGGNVKLSNVIRVNRTMALYQSQKIYFDRISHKGKTYYEVGMTVDRSKERRRKDNSIELFTELLNKFNVDYVQADRRSIKYR